MFLFFEKNFFRKSALVGAVTIITKLVSGQHVHLLELSDIKILSSQNGNLGNDF